MIINRPQGFTLIELVFTIGVVIILLGNAIPAFSNFLNKQKIMSHTLNLKASLQDARATAITHKHKVTICPTSNNLACDNNWSSGYMVFLDLNNDRQLDDNERLIKAENLNDPNIKISWKAYGVRSSLQWHEAGITNHQNGTFQLCYQKNPKYARALIISKAGRIKHSDDKDADGIHENASGKNLQCG